MDRRNFFTFLGFTAIAASEAADKNLLALTAPGAAKGPATALPPNREDELGSVQCHGLPIHKGSES